MVGSSIRMAFGVLINPIEINFNWDQGTITLAYAISNVVTALFSPAAAWLSNRIGARKSMMVGTIILFIGILAIGYIRSPLEFYVYVGGLMGIAQAIILIPLIPSAMVWFRRHLGLGIGMIMGSWGLGPALATPLIGFLVGAFEWKSAFAILAFGTASIMVILIALFRNRPSDMGIEAYGTLPSDKNIDKTKPDSELLTKFNGYMRKTSAYWNMSSIHFLGCVGHSVILVYIIPLAIQNNMSVLQASSLITLMSGTSVISRLVTPMLCEKYGTKFVMGWFYFLQGIPVIMLFGASDPMMFYGFALFFGVGLGGESAGFPILMRQYYGFAPSAAPHGTQMLWAGLGMALGGWVGGIVYDIYGNYNIAFVISILASFAGMVSVFFLESTSKLLIPKWEDS